MRALERALREMRVGEAPHLFSELFLFRREVEIHDVLSGPRGLPGAGHIQVSRRSIGGFCLEA